ncbi:glycosyltransferase family 2 protein [Candidatus Beckwithbacteria bacterium]|nr:glycosyltransferase family 2 protein [Candidatus Beckwithbacteria bacterium]
MLSVIILTHNEEQMLPKALESVKNLADEILVIDKKSTDSTLEIAKKFNAKLVKFEGEEFDQWRNLGIEHAKGDWLFYLDPDERVTENLAKEIRAVIDQEENDVYKMKRQNYWWGKQFQYCGASPDWVTRLFKKEKLQKWQGIIHESPVYEGKVGELENSLVHFTHRDFVSGLKKSYQWTRMEAQLFYNASHPPVKVKNLVSVFVKKFWQKYISQKGYQEGVEGFIESLVQAINRFMVYVLLWEMQQEPSLEEKYKKLDN